MDRIQKLLETEYNNFYEEVLVEGPFAQLSSQKKGIRAVQIALTERSLIIASDKFLHEGKLTTAKLEALDPEIETLELVNVIPLKHVRIKLTRKGLHDKFYMKVILKKSPSRCWKVYEFGGHFLKHFFWVVWQEKLLEMNEYKELFRTSPSIDYQVERIFDTSNFNEDQSVSLTEERPFGPPTSFSSFKKSFENLMMDEMTQFPSALCSKGSTRAFRETAL